MILNLSYTPNRTNSNRKFKFVYPNFEKKLQGSMEISMQSHTKMANNSSRWLGSSSSHATEGRHVPYKKL